MISDEHLLRIRRLLHSWSRLLALGYTARSLRSALQEGRIIRVHRGWYVTASVWRGLTAEDRHLGKILAVAACAQSPPVFSDHSAALLHDLELYRFRGDRVHIATPPDARRSSTPSIGYSSRELTDDEIVEVGGLLRCVSLSRTTLDLARSAPAEVALPCLDRALRRSGSTPQEQQAWLQVLIEKNRSRATRPGVGRAERLLALGDGGAESVLESISRLQLHRLGFETATQVRVPSPRGGWYRVDLEILGLGILCEVDGRAKYTDPALRGGRTADEVVYDEKRREDWIRNVTGKRLIRLAPDEVATAPRLARVLGSFGIELP